MSNTFINPMAYAQGRNDKPFKYSFLENTRMLAGMNCLQPGQSQPLHDHTEQDKFYFVLSGEGFFTVGDENRTCATGELVLCPAGFPHGVENRSEGLLTILTVIAPWDAPPPLHIRHPLFTAEAVLEFLQLLEEHGIPVWLDGGWAVDALLGEQTRPHEDIDIVLSLTDVPLLWTLLTDRGYRDIARNDTRPWNFVMGNERGEMVDFHAVLFDEAGNGIYGPQRDGAVFPAACFSGRGEIAGRAVQCLTPEQIVEFHSKYTPDANDIGDVAALCARYGIAYPESYPHPHGAR